MAGVIVNGIKYICLLDPNKLKQKSLENNIYFTLRDIFWNGETCDMIRANHFNSILVESNHTYKDRNFKFSNILYDYNSDFLQNLYTFLLNFSKSRICFTNSEIDCVNGNNKYISFDIWFTQLQQLIGELKKLLKNIKYRENKNNIQKH